MIPVFQTRRDLSADDGIGNCLEACLASILELPLATVPDRSRMLSPEWRDRLLAALEAEDERAVEKVAQDGELDRAVEDVRRWLARLGIGLLDEDLETRKRFERFAERMGREHRGYWVGMHFSTGDPPAPHATVWYGSRCAHNPTRGLLDVEGLNLDRPLGAWILTAADPARIVRRLEPTPAVEIHVLPDPPHVAEQIRELRQAAR